MIVWIYHMLFVIVEYVSLHIVWVLILKDVSLQVAQMAMSA